MKWNANGKNEISTIKRTKINKIYYLRIKMNIENPKIINGSINLISIKSNNQWKCKKKQSE